MARIVRVHLGYCGVGVVVLWSVELCFGVLEFVYLYGSSVGVEIVDVKGCEKSVPIRLSAISIVQ